MVRHWTKIMFEYKHNLSIDCTVHLSLLPSLGMRSHFIPTEVSRYLSLVLYFWSFDSSLLFVCTCGVGL